jgi:ATP-dependent RNA helicase RhlB
MSTQDHLSSVRFDSLALAEPLKKGLSEAGFEFATPIQAESIPKFLEGTDLAGQAQTGTGKTVAFLLCTMHELLTKPAAEGRKSTQPRAMILAPTRELAIQIAKDAEPLAKHTDLKIALAYGGTDYEKQRDTIAAGCDILVGTPGRVIDFFKQRVFDLSHCEVTVLDEADRMFDLGFIADLRFLLRNCPAAEKRRNLLFSATMSGKVMDMAYEHMGDPVVIKIEADQITADRVRQRMFYPANHEKIPLLAGLLKEIDPPRCIIFVNTKSVSEKIWRHLTGNDFKVEIISGDVRQKKRERLLEEFKSGELKLLIATDVAARGLHITGVTHVVNFDLPDDAEDYVHRIGRTARAGESGDAISFACETYAFNLGPIEKFIDAKIPLDDITSEMLPELKPPVRLPEGSGPRGRGGNRNGGNAGGRSGGGRGPRR